MKSPLYFELRGSALKVIGLSALFLAFSVGVPVSAFLRAVLRNPEPTLAGLDSATVPIGEHFALARVPGAHVYWLSVATFFATHVFYYAVSTAIQFWFYRGRSATPELWKVQPSKTASLRSPDRELWWLPLRRVFAAPQFVSKLRFPLHNRLATINLALSAFVAALVVELVLRGKTMLSFAPLTRADGSLRVDVLLGPLLQGTFIGFVAEQAFQYYWHRVMHTPFWYKRWHKTHHAYKAPEPFDDLMIWPLEGFAYYFMLFSPPMLCPIHVSGFLVYFLVHGLSGVADHCGVHFWIPLVYNAADHDAHHSHFEVNYATPFPYMDILHGTFRGEFFGVRFEHQGKLGAHHESSDVPKISTSSEGLKTS